MCGFINVCECKSVFVCACMLQPFCEMRPINLTCAFCEFLLSRMLLVFPIISDLVESLAVPVDMLEVGLGHDP